MKWRIYLIIEIKILNFLSYDFKNGTFDCKNKVLFSLKEVFMTKEMKKERPEREGTFGSSLIMFLILYCHIGIRDYLLGT